MFFSYINLLIFISFCSFIWIDAINHDDKWSWTNTKYLTQSNLSSLLIPQKNSSIWFIFSYLNSCQEAKSDWETVSQYAINWSKNIQTGAYDCTNESLSNTDLCQNKPYPQYYIYCPLTNSIQLAFRSEQSNAEEILIKFLEKLNEIADECYGKPLPIPRRIDLGSGKIIKSLKLDEKTVTTTDTIERNTTVSLKPTVSDIDGAVIWMLNRDLHRGLPDLKETLQTWINTLYTYYTGSDTIRNVLYNLTEYLRNHSTLTSAEFRSYINSTPDVNISEIKFDHCNDSDSLARGYPCSLWVLFHSLTVKQAILDEQNQLPSNINRSDVIISIREFIRSYYLCFECVTHFTNMTANAENEINSSYDSVLYLWRAHNLVNERLRYNEYTNDPNWPKVPFPTKQQCDLCVTKLAENADALEYDEHETYKFLQKFYYGKNSARNCFQNSLLFFSTFVLHILIMF